MTRNDTPDKLEWSIRPRSGTDSAQWDWGIKESTDLHYPRIMKQDSLGPK